MQNIRICSMYSIFTYIIWLEFTVHVGKYSTNGASGTCKTKTFQTWSFQLMMFLLFRPLFFSGLANVLCLPRSGIITAQHSDPFGRSTSSLGWKKPGRSETCWFFSTKFPYTASKYSSISCWYYLATQKRLPYPPSTELCNPAFFGDYFQPYSQGPFNLHGVQAYGSRLRLHPPDFPDPPRGAKWMVKGAILRNPLGFFHTTKRRVLV